MLHPSIVRRCSSVVFRPRVTSSASTFVGCTQNTTLNRVRLSQDMACICIEGSLAGMNEYDSHIVCRISESGSQRKSERSLREVGSRADVESQKL